MTSNDLYAEMEAILAEVGELLGISMGEVRLLRLHSNALFVVPGPDLLIRIATNRKHSSHAR